MIGIMGGINVWVFTFSSGNCRVQTLGFISFPIMGRFSFSNATMLGTFLLLAVATDLLHIGNYMPSYT